MAEGLGRKELALKARLVAFQSVPSLADYEALRRLSGEKWPQIQPPLKEILYQKGGENAIVDVMLSEGQIEEAIKVVEGSWNWHLLDRVTEAAIYTHPDWVIRVSQKQAESLIERVQSKYYEASLRWLEKVRAAYRAQSRPEGWQNYLADLRARHNRKRTLLALLEERFGPEEG